MILKIKMAKGRVLMKKKTAFRHKVDENIHTVINHSAVVFGRQKKKKKN